jgi:predicted NBD/HSP70 family sugar kinase
MTLFEASVRPVQDVDVLTRIPSPGLSREQLSLFTRDSLRATAGGRFSTAEAKRANGNVWVVDIGGTALKAYPVTVENGSTSLSSQDGIIVECEDGGCKTYMEALTEIGKRASESGLPVGISTAGIVRENELVDSPNLPNFTRELKEAGGFPRLLGKRLVVSNDARAGLLTGAVEAAEIDPTRHRVIYLINGGGIGGAALDADGSIISMEPGHIRAVRELLGNGTNNSHCDFMERKYAPIQERFACIEQVGAMGAGVVEQWQKLTGIKLEGRKIAERMYNGDKTALALIQDLVVASAHAAAGMMDALGYSPSDTTIVLHGGGFKPFGVVESMGAILKKHYNSQNVRLLQLSGNGCLKGVAIEAAML